MAVKDLLWYLNLIGQNEGLYFEEDGHALLIKSTDKTENSIILKYSNAHSLDQSKGLDAQTFKVWKRIFKRIAKSQKYLSGNILGRPDLKLQYLMSAYNDNGILDSGIGIYRRGYVISNDVYVVSETPKTQIFTERQLEIIEAIECRKLDPSPEGACTIVPNCAIPKEAFCYDESELIIHTGSTDSRLIFPNIAVTSKADSSIDFDKDLDMSETRDLSVVEFNIHRRLQILQDTGRIHGFIHTPDGYAIEVAYKPYNRSDRVLFKKGFIEVCRENDSAAKILTYIDILGANYNTINTSKNSLFDRLCSPDEFDISSYCDYNLDEGLVITIPFYIANPSYSLKGGKVICDFHSKLVVFRYFKNKSDIGYFVLPKIIDSIVKPAINWFDSMSHLHYQLGHRETHKEVCKEVLALVKEEYLKWM